MRLSPFTKRQMIKLRKFIDRLGERLQQWVHKYELPVIVKNQLTDDDCNLLQALLEHPGWEVALVVRDNIQHERNERAIGFCDGRSLVEFKKMESLDEYVDTMTEIVEQHRKKTAPAKEPKERPRKLAEYVPR